MLARLAAVGIVGGGLVVALLMFAALLVRLFL